MTELRPSKTEGWGRKFVSSAPPSFFVAPNRPGFVRQLILADVLLWIHRVCSCLGISGPSPLHLKHLLVILCLVFCSSTNGPTLRASGPWFSKSGQVLGLPMSPPPLIFYHLVPAMVPFGDFIFPPPVRATRIFRVLAFIKFWFIRGLLASPDICTIRFQWGWGGPGRWRRSGFSPVSDRLSWIPGRSWMSGISLHAAEHVCP